ncbi:glycosyltransferase family 4 protein [Shewanella sp. 10N.286.51.B2]|uniref:glycosyltransferase family 4 protein n=1 Tax=Shewanella sp. 10N.286.51.B2 TaxID=3229707 RepID=UPI00354D479A
MKILLLTYAVSPYRGSEYSVAWNHITQIAKNHQVTVLYGTSGAHIGDDDDMRDFHKRRKIDNVEWHRVLPSNLTNSFNFFNKKGYFTYSFYVAYRRWHKDVYDYCKSNINVDDFDVVHFQSPIGYREPGYLWKLGLPYLWGPIGGANSLDSRLLSALPKSGKVKLLIRKVLNLFQLRYSFRLKKALKATDLLLTATTENQDVFETIHGVKSVYLPENGTIGEYLGEIKHRECTDKVNLIWIGSIDARKALRLLIDSFEYIDDPHVFTVHVLGNGPLKDDLTAYAEERGLGSVFVWHGHISRKQVLETIQNADLHVITSVSEANTTVIWESIQNGVPTMSLDHCGMRDIISENSGIKVKLADYPKLVESFGRALDNISKDKRILTELVPGVKESFYKYHWDKRVVLFDDLYEKAIKNWQSKNSIKNI